MTNKISNSKASIKHPYPITKIVITQNDLNNVIEEAIKLSIVDEVKRLYNKYQNLFNEEIIFFGKVWYDRKVHALYPLFSAIENYPVIANNKREEIANYKGFKIDNMFFTSPNSNDVKKSFSSAPTQCSKKKWMPKNVCTQYDNYPYYVIPSEYKKDLYHQHPLFRQDIIKHWDDSDKCVILLSYKLECINKNNNITTEDIFINFLKRGLIPDDITNAIDKEAFIELGNLCNVLGISFQSLDSITLSRHYTPALLDIKKIRKYKAICKVVDEDKLNIQKEAFSKIIEQKKNDYIRSDLYRCNLIPYANELVTDLNRGHWELCDVECSAEEIEINIPESYSLVARPPQLDVLDNGVCGIDFGTKSTIVACENRGARLLRIGKGDLNENPSLEDYENPTIMKFINLEKFIKDYASSPARPKTKWNDLIIAHQAKDSLMNSESSSVSSKIFSDLKQWANATDYYLRLTDDNGFVLDLKPYMKLEEGDFDPIEVYAYYLGLYINNMHQGIYLEYVLSFPVNYSNAIRNRLLSSFKRGLKKSLPKLIQNDMELMESFDVYAGASEPAAYAISALDALNLEPEELDDKCAYAVFDFGGGTTDFDFGIEYIPEDERYNYEIRQFGKGGDVYLGGEHILSLMSYHIYKNNINKMREHNIPILLPPKCDRFAGSETLVFDLKSAPEAAHLNLKLLNELLRPIWEEADTYQELGETPQAQLLFTLNNTKESIDLDIDIAYLETIVRERIEEGVDNFFTKFKMVIADKENHLDYKAPFHIFLAGNSCKSSIVINLFLEKIQNYEVEYKEALGEKNDVKIFELHYPLGFELKNREDTTDTKKVSKESNGIVNTSNLDIDKIRTGKTGVAFGLIRSRRSARDIKIINQNIDEVAGEITFPYLLGMSNRKQYFKTTVPIDVPYNVWTKFTFADEPFFEIYYTKNMQANQLNAIKSEDTSRMRITIPELKTNPKPNDFIFVRKVNPNTIEFAIGATVEELNNNDNLKLYQYILK